VIPRRHPKRTRRRAWQELRERRGQGIFLLPSLLTTGNLVCGFFALVLTAQARYVEAALAIFVAMIMDALDGRVARLMKATSQFGVAPAFLLYAFALSSLGRPAWFAAFLFVICGALRLARFNVYTGVIDKRFFMGLPIPAAAGVAASTVILLHGDALTRAEAVALAVLTYAVALLMVSTFRYWSFKEVDFARRRPLQTLLALVLAGMIVATHHEIFLFLVFVGYAASGPVRRLIVGRMPAVTPADLKEHP